MALTICLVVILIGLLGIAAARLRAWQRSTIKMVFLELHPPLSNDNQLDSIEAYYKVLHDLLGSNKLKFWLPAKQIAFEIVSSSSGGIRFIAVIPPRLEQAFRSVTIAHLPEVKIETTTDYFINEPKFSAIDTYKLSKHFSRPLKNAAKLNQIDHLAYLTGAMTKLSKAEVAALQIVISAGNLLKQKRQLRKVTSAYRYLFSEKRIDFINQADYESRVAKLQQPLFRVSIRSLMVSADGSITKQRKNLIRNALCSIAGESDQRLTRRITRSIHAKQKYSLRSLGLTASNNLLSSAELGLIYHFPIVSSTNTENLSRSLSHTLPAPVSLKNGTKLDVLLGINKHHGSKTPIGLSKAERERHVYIIGGTGNGKTTMLLYAITQDMKAGKGLAVVDPHGDLAEELLIHTPEARIKDVIYMNPDDLTHPIGVNLLELPEGLTGDELLREKDLVTESTISVLRKIFSDDDTGGHRIEYVLRNTIQTALTLENPTLFSIFSLLNDNKFRKEVVAKLEDKDLKNFWRNELAKAGSFQRVKMSAGITAKIGRFLFSASARRVLEQPTSTINFEDIIDSGKILICNFSKGLIGEDTSTLFGTTILAKLQMASLRRARLNQADRRPFYLYVDEFQNFATISFVQMLSEARKYKLFLTMAEQSTTQQQYQRLVEVILANVGTVICFRSGSPADERLILPLFRPFIEEGEIANLASFNFYMRIAGLQAQEPLSGQTMLLDGAGSAYTAERVKEHSRRQYSIEYKEKHQPVTIRQKSISPSKLSSPGKSAQESAKAF